MITVRLYPIVVAVAAVVLAFPVSAQECPNCQDSRCPSNYVYLDDDPAEVSVVGFTSSTGCVYCGNQNGSCACDLLLQCSTDFDLTDAELEHIGQVVARGDEAELRALMSSRPMRVSYEPEHEAIAVWGCGHSLLALLPLDSRLREQMNAGTSVLPGRDR